MSFSISRNFYAPVNFDIIIRQYGCFISVHFSKKSSRLFISGPKILAFVSQCSARFHPNLDCFIANFKLKYKYSENIKADRVNTVVFNLNQTSSVFFLGHPVKKLSKKQLRLISKEMVVNSFVHAQPF